jgi:hypothetical protein
MTITQQSDEFIDSLVSETPELTHHHYTAKQQATYLKQLKENLQSDQCIAGRLLRELFIYSPGCHRGISLGNLSGYSSSFCCLQNFLLYVISDCLNHNSLSFIAFKRH